MINGYDNVTNPSRAVCLGRLIPTHLFVRDRLRCPSEKKSPRVVRRLPNTPLSHSALFPTPIFPLSNSINGVLPMAMLLPSLRPPSFRPFLIWNRRCLLAGSWPPMRGLGGAASSPSPSPPSPSAPPAPRAATGGFFRRRPSPGSRPS